MAIQVGAFLGRYHITAEIGRGTMGVVYCAWDPKISRTVAIKTVSLAGLEPDAEREFRERFVVEAQAVGRLSHPGIITVFDVAEDSETRLPYLVMEYIESRSLDQVLRDEKDGRLPLNDALRLAQEIAEALNYAHGQGVVHRDIKPANILVTADGHAKITDFGVAKLNQTQLTQQGQLLGSPAFMAPEQLSDEGGDARSDLFSLGVVLYTMLTGQRPFQGNSIATVCFKLTTFEPLPVATYDMSFPPELEPIMTRAMAKNPDQRYQSGSEMADDIGRLREISGLVQTPEPGQNVPARALPPAHSGNLSWSPILVLVCLVGIAALVLFLRTGTVSPQPPVNRARADRSIVEPMNRGAEADPSVPSPPPPPPSSRRPLPSPAASASLDLRIEHPFTDARASIWSDNQLVYNQVLPAAGKNHLLIFRQAHGHEFRTVSLSPGKHQVRVRVQSPVADYDQSRTVAVNLAPKGETILRIDCDKKHNRLHLTLQ